MREPHEGRRFGDYELLGEIARGGMGVVYRARQISLDRIVALKLILFGPYAGEASVRRFRAEAAAAAQLQHPNIVAIHEVGEEAGQHFFSMAYVQGQNLADYAREHPVTARQAARLLETIAEAIHHAHGQGIVHRDLKPSNILIDGSGEPRITDFGLAKRFESAESGAVNLELTLSGQVLGSPSYVPPEQASGRRGQVGPKTDIYALGAILYFLLTGRPPFAAETVTDTLQQVLNEDPVSPRLLNPSVPRDLETICLKCLEKDSGRRYETANAFAEDIRRYLAHEPVIASAPSASYRFGKFARRNKTALTVAVVIVTILVVATLASTWQAIRATRAEELARQRVLEVAAERDQKEMARQEAEATSTFLTEVFQSPDPEHDGRTITVAETLDGAARKLDALARQPVPRARLQTTLGKTYHALGLDRDAIPLLEKARDYYLATLGREHPDTLSTMGNLAISYHEAGRREEALKLREEVLALRRKVNGPEHPDTLLAMHYVANSCHYGGRRDEAFRLFDEVLALRRKVNGPEHPETLLAMHYVANSYAEAGRRDEALKLREEVLALRRKVNGPEHPETFRTMRNLADSYHSAGRREEAFKLREDVLALRRKVNGPEHPETLRAMGSLAASHFDAGRREEALKLREEVLALCRKVFDPENPATLSAMASVAVSYFDAGRREEALKLREEVLTLRRKVLGPENNTLWAMHYLADSYFDAGRREEALKLREEVLTLRRKVLGPEHPEALSAMDNLAISYYDTGRREKALKLREEVLALRRKVLGPEYPDTLWAMDNLAISYHDAGRREEALKLREEALALRHKVLRPEHPSDKPLILR